MRGRRAAAWLTSGQRLVRNLGARPGAERQVDDHGGVPDKDGGTKVMTLKRRWSGHDRAARRGLPAGLPVSRAASAPVDVHAIREHFAFPRLGRIVTNNAASTQPPDELLALYQSLAPGYENVHRGQSSASQAMTALFEESYDTIARFIGAPGRASIALYRNTTEAHNAVMYSLLTEFRDGDNVVTTTMEHNSNYVPWYAMCREILPRLGRRVHYRLARFDPVTGELDLDHLASLIDARTKLVCCTGASNFLGTQNPLRTIRALANASGYRQPSGERRSYVLIDGAQLVPGRSSTFEILTWNTCRFRFTRCWRRSGWACCTPSSICWRPRCPSSTAATWSPKGACSPTGSSTTPCHGSIPPERLSPWCDHLSAGPAYPARSGDDTEQTHLLPDSQAHRTRRCSCGHG
jgi:Aminotransferase class-V